MQSKLAANERGVGWGLGRRRMMGGDGAMRRGDGVALALATSIAAALVAASVMSMRRKRKSDSWLEVLCRRRSQSEALQGVSPGIGHGSKESGLAVRSVLAVREGVLGAIGNTPLIRIRSLSEATGCEIYGKAEFLNPGGSVKDRVAAKIIDEALQSGALRVGGVVTEGSAGSTAVSLAMVALAYGCRCHVVLPDDAAIEKTQILESMGATVERVRPVSITHKDHFVNVARRRASEAQAVLRDIPSPEPQLSNLTTDGLGLDIKLDTQVQEHLKVQNHASGDSGTTLQNGDQFSREDSGATRPAACDFVNCLEKEMADTQTRMLHIDCDSKQCMPIHGVDVSQAGNHTKEGSVEETVNSDSALGVRQNGASEDCCSSVQGGFFADQFENLANFRAHYEGTAPELWRQTGGKVDAFVAAAGTGGTIAGISRYLKEQNGEVKCYLIDPPGSGLYNRVTRGVMYTREEAEGKRMKNPFDTITEGIGINRITANFKQAQLDGAFRGTDKEAVEMARYLMKNDGLFVGSSSAMNCVGAVRVAQLLGPGHVIVTILCDGGARHLSKFHNPAYLAAQGLTPSATSLEFL